MELGLRSDVAGALDLPLAGVVVESIGPAAAPPGGEAADEAEAAAAVDWAVDAALDKAFGAEFLAAVLGYGDEDVLA